MRCSPSAENHGLHVLTTSSDLLFPRSPIQNCHKFRIVRYSVAASFDANKTWRSGVRRVTSLAIPAFLASSASTLPLKYHILALRPCPGTILEQYLSTWSSSGDTDGIPDPLPRKQSFWDTPSLLADHARIEPSLVEQSQRPRFLASQAPHSGTWLLALPAVLGMI